MHEWWATHFKLLINSGLNKKDVEVVINFGKIKLQNGFKKFVDLLYNRNIPLVIISSTGLDIDEITIFFQKENFPLRRYGNIYIISNVFKRNKQDEAISVKNPLSTL